MAVTDALTAAIRGTEMDPGKYSYAWNAMGNALRRLGRPDEALQAFEAAIARNGKNAVFWGNKAIALHELGRHSEAAEAERRAKELGG